MSEAIKVPDNVFVHCPKESFQLTRAVKCNACEHCNGLARIQDGGEFIQEFRIKCAHPTLRRMEVVNI